MREAIGTVVGFGGYCDLRRTLRFMMTGEHEWEGRRYRLEPDPYGRWIIAANYLPEVPEYAGMEGARRRCTSWRCTRGPRGQRGGPDLRREEGRAARPLAPEEREIWDLLAHPSGARPPDAAAARAGRPALRGGARRHPQLDPRPSLAHLRQRSSSRTATTTGSCPSPSCSGCAGAPPRLRVHATVTRLFAHSREADPLRPWEYPGEAVRYLRLLSRALAPR
jgi:hypothetical protein